MKNYIAFDVGGTNIKYGVINSLGEIITKNKFKTPSDSLDNLIDSMVEIIKSYQKEYKVEGLALSCPGAVDNIVGDIKGSSALAYIHGPNIRNILNSRTGLEVSMENDANCAALAEVWKGSASDVEDVLFVVIGTGIGGAVIKDRKLHVGKHLHGGEFGYMIMEKDFQSGELTNFSEAASSYAIRKKASELKGVSIEELEGEEIFSMAQQGDKLCQEAIDICITNLAIGIFNLQYSFDPEKILLGGAISAREDIVNLLNEKIKYLISLKPIATIFPTIERCKFKNDANLIGAVYNYISSGK